MDMATEIIQYSEQLFLLLFLLPIECYRISVVLQHKNYGLSIQLVHSHCWLNLLKLSLESFDVQHAEKSQALQ